MLSLTTDNEIRQQVREFYESVGWTNIGGGLYQNARYEDLRPVAREYITRCHRRVRDRLPRQGDAILDAGSGPIQYPEYLEFSQGFSRRVCLDISRRALGEARARVGDHGLFVVGDISRLPFCSEAFDAAVSMHTVHHVPLNHQRDAFEELYRVQRPGAPVVVIHSWGRNSVLMRVLEGPQKAVLWVRTWIARLRGRGQPAARTGALGQPGTYTHHPRPRDLVGSLKHLPELEVRVWRSVSTGFMRAFIDPRLFGREILRLVYWIEERAPHVLGRWGQYPLVSYRKPPRE
ncbi:MAG: class I SAM-dependent methyltransferase [Anaerolineales bacterium]